MLTEGEKAKCAGSWLRCSGLTTADRTPDIFSFFTFEQHPRADALQQSWMEKTLKSETFFTSSTADEYILLSLSTGVLGRHEILPQRSPDVLSGKEKSRGKDKRKVTKHERIPDRTSNIKLCTLLDLWTHCSPACTSR